MLNQQQERFTYQHAYVPEQLPEFVQSVSGAEAYLHEDYICYVVHDHLIFVGYPLTDQCMTVEQAYKSVCKRFRPATVAVIAASISFHQGLCEGQTEDRYHKLDLPLAAVPSRVAYMIRRAARELRVCEGAFGDEHEQLLTAFVAARELSPAHQEIFSGIPKYLDASRTACLLEARKNVQLVAFSIVDLGSADYAFYMFSFRSLTTRVPGASDLLFHEMTLLAQGKGKRAINLGLGINPGVTHFKEKWGATPFLPCVSALIRRRSGRLMSLLTGL